MTAIERMVAQRCYTCDDRTARYEAHLDYDCTPVVLLCEDCAGWERESGSVEWIRTCPGRERAATAR